MANILFGGMLGVGALVLTAWLGLAPGRSVPDPFSIELVSWLGSPQDSNTAPLRFPAYFALLGLLTGGWKSLTVRDRKARFRLVPILLTTLVAAILFPVGPTSVPSNIAAAVSIAIVTQLVSPWSEEAAAYAQALKKRRAA
ncbi:hypothetical protein V5E97_25835 [Singulisphaera sp. Ch08]|uniref:Uncharacterized protein n=1 Tax=Singulisphaera sp. Ch08 TaxID=3120278 RepID=A0AAU7C9D9_9BACT